MAEEHRRFRGILRDIISEEILRSSQVKAFRLQQVDHRRLTNLRLPNYSNRRLHKHTAAFSSFPELQLVWHPTGKSRADGGADLPPSRHTPPDYHFETGILSSPGLFTQADPSATAATRDSVNSFFRDSAHIDCTRQTTGHLPDILLASGHHQRAISCFILRRGSWRGSLQPTMPRPPCMNLYYRLLLSNITLTSEVSSAVVAAHISVRVLEANGLTSCYLSQSFSLAGFAGTGDTAAQSAAP